MQYSYNAVQKSQAYYVFLFSLLSHLTLTYETLKHQKMHSWMNKCCLYTAQATWERTNFKLYL